MDRILRLATAGCFAFGACWSSSPPAPSTPPPAVAEEPPACFEVFNLLRDRLLTATPAEYQAQVAAKLGGRVEQATHTCEVRTYSPTLRRCMYAAVRDVPLGPATEQNLQVAISTCIHDALAAAGHDMGGPTCDDVLAHLISVASNASEDDLAKVRREMLGLCPSFTRATKECIVRQSTPTSLEPCIELSQL